MVVDQNGNRHNGAYKRRQAVLISLVTTIVTMGFVTMVYYFFIKSTVLFNHENCRSVEGIFYCYISQASAWDESTYLQTITGFYNTVITLLISTLAIVAAFGAYTIKASIRSQIEQEFPGHVADYFEREKGFEQLNKASRAALNASIDSLPMPQEGGLRNYIASLESKLEKMELQLQAMQEEVE